jgi:F-type H+-transporting ATPase subunit b
MHGQVILNLILADEGSSFWEWMDHYFNYPGLEVWKFFNLLVFVSVMIYILRRPMSDAFKARRDRIREELQKAQQERDAALAQLKEIETRVARLDEEVKTIREQAEAEADAERARLSRETASELAKLKESAQREIEAAGKLAKQQLREFAAQESVRLAEETIRREMRPDDDARLIGISVEQLGRSNN